ncbi:hypothetical protein [uncultured Halopseudomonas sp.]|uniref:hypothetical protein n=1 Tax=uncultured Halopseudomonas sp. TaxID=2901193 RepID=UPI0030EC5817|tara:strand:- start:11106 stop:11576 length:471 start_codon:yes stop_codon:yes gene_type:complete
MLLTVLRVIFFYVIGVLLATVLGSIAQTQINLWELQQLAVSFPWAERLAVTLGDLAGFTPFFGVMVAVSFLVALPVAQGLGKIFKPWRWLLFFLAGAVGIWVACLVANYVLPMPTFIAATRETPGLLILMASVGIGSWLFGRLTRPPAKRGLRVLG